jgi:N-hydroxyarylamine O-acetyltransferase
MPETDNFEIDTYLARIGLAGRPTPTLSGLRDLVRAQQRTIVFENLDPIVGAPVLLDSESLWRKMVVQKRGGYCFELNYLLGLAMERLGLSYTPLLARVMMGAPVGGPKSHLLFSVAIDGAEYLADAGFGGPGLLEPMRLESEVVVEQDGAKFRLVEPEREEYILQRSTPNGWFNVFTFNREKVLPVDVEVANYFTSTMPKSPFRNRLICALQTPEGLVTTRDNDLVTLAPDLVPISASPLKDAAGLERALAETFQLEVSAEMVRQVWQRVAVQA